MAWDADWARGFTFFGSLPFFAVDVNGEDADGVDVEVVDDDASSFPERDAESFLPFFGLIRTRSPQQ